MQNNKQEKSQDTQNNVAIPPPAEDKNWFLKKYEEHVEERVELQEEFYKKKLFIAAERLKKNEPLNNTNVFDLSFYLRDYFDQEEKKKYDGMRNEFKNTSFIVSALSLGNVVIVGALWRKFLSLKTWQKTGVCVGTFILSHKSGMYISEKKSLEFQNAMVEKYKKHIYEINFDEISLPKKKKE